jgi:OOP family OmpA-OmpF porin
LHEDAADETGHKIDISWCAGFGPRGCAGQELPSVQEMEAGGSAFNKALFGEYLDRSSMEYAEGDYIKSDLFAVKARGAAAGEDVGPVVLADHRLPASAVGELSQARRELVEALDGNGRTTVPELAAHTQRQFDCWVEEQEENIQPEDIAACRAAFWAGLKQIQDAIRPAPMAAEPEPEPMAAPEPAPAMEVPQMPVFFVFLDFDSADLDAKAQGLVENIAKQIGIRDPARVFITGHADKAGSHDYNMALSERRAQAVADAIAGHGVDAMVLTAMAMSEDEPRVDTADGARERQNRYVKVTIIP